MEVLDVTIVNVALRHIAGSLAASLDESTWILTSYLVANAIVLPISGWLANVIGRKRFYMICVALFTASQHAVRDVRLADHDAAGARRCRALAAADWRRRSSRSSPTRFRRRSAAQAFALYGLTVVTAPAVGPTLGGWLTDSLLVALVLPDQPAGRPAVAVTGADCSSSSRGIAARPQAPAGRRSDGRLRGLRADRRWALARCRSCSTAMSATTAFPPASSPACAISRRCSLMAWWCGSCVHPQPAVNVRLLRSRAFAISCL